MAVTYPKTTAERAKLYLHCMVEIRERILIVRALADWPVQPLFVRELCYLQFRHICEVLAIACLAAQGDFKTQRAFRDEYSPPVIFRALREIYPDFFPTAAVRIYTPGKDGEPASHHLEGLPDSAAYKEEDVSNLWSRSGDLLHRLSAAKYLKKSFKPEQSSLDDIQRHAIGLWTLLEGHIIVLKKAEKRTTLLHVEVEPNGGPFHAHFLYVDAETLTVQVESYSASRVG